MPIVMLQMLQCKLQSTAIVQLNIAGHKVQRMHSVHKVVAQHQLASLL